MDFVEYLLLDLSNAISFVVYWESIEWMGMGTKYLGRTFILYLFFRLKLYLEPEEIHNADEVIANLHALLVGSWRLPSLYYI